MKFSLFVHMERNEPDVSHAQLFDELTELVQIAERGGMHAVWIGEHHGMEFTISPNPLINIAYLAAKTERVRLGTGSLIAPFWHPVKMAGECAMADIATGGRLDVGIARGAYSFEYQRLGDNLDATEAGLRMRELIPAVQQMWRGDYAHEGQYWSFPATTSVPAPAQPGGPPIWVAARDPNSHHFAVAQGCNVQVTPLSSGDEEVASLMQRFKDACAAHPEIPRPKIMLLQHTYVASDEADVQQGARELARFYAYFGAWFKNTRPVERGFIAPLTEAEIEANPMVSPELMIKNLVIGTAGTVVDRVRGYEALGYDQFSIWIDSGMSFQRKKASLQRFISEVMPAFSGT